MQVYSLITRRNELQSCRQHPPPAAMSTTVLVGVGCVILTTIMVVVRYLCSDEEDESNRTREKPHKGAAAAAPPRTNKLFEEASNNVMNMKTGIFAWRIDRFSRRVGVVKSYVFPTSASPDAGKWWLELETRHVVWPVFTMESFSFRECVCVSLHGVKPIPKLVGLTLFSKDERRGTRRQLENKVFYERATENPVWETTLGDRDFVLDPANDLLHNDVLNLECELEIEIPRRKTPAKRR